MLICRLFNLTKRGLVGERGAEEQQHADLGRRSDGESTYVYMYVCVCKYICIYRERER